MELRMAFYAGITRRGVLTVSTETAQRWREALPLAIEEEYARLDNGELPRRLTVDVVLGTRGPPTGEEAKGAAAASERPPGSG